MTSGGPLVTADARGDAGARARRGRDLTGLVRLSVQSAGIAATPAGDPKLQVKLGISGATWADPTRCPKTVSRCTSARRCPPRCRRTATRRWR